MRGRSLSILGIFAAVAAAVLLLCFNSIKYEGVVITGGILFMAVGLVNLLFFSSVSKNESATGRVLTLIANAAAIVLGIIMLVFISVFTPLIAFIFGLIVGICALWQFFVLAIGARPYQLPAWLYLFPILLAGGCAYIFLRHPTAGEDHILMLTTGISLALLGIACVVEGSILGVARRADHKKKAQENAAAEKAPATEPTNEQEAAQPVNPYTADKEYQEIKDTKEPKRRVETTDDLDDEIIEDEDR